LIHNGATTATKLPRFDPKVMPHSRFLRACRCLEEPFATANFAEFFFHVSRERALRPTPIEPGSPEEGCPYRQVLCTRHTDQSGGGLRASGRGKAKGQSFPAKLRPFTPLSERSCVYYSGTRPGGRQEKSRAALEGGIQASPAQRQDCNAL
jgi:hypothetical protein